MMNTHLKTFLHGSLFSFIAMFIGGVVNYLTRRYLALHLSEYNFGLFYGMFSFVCIAGSFAEFGLTQSGTVLFAEAAAAQKKNEFPKIFSALIVLRAIFCTLIFAGLLLFHAEIRKGFGGVAFPTYLLICLLVLIQIPEGTCTSFWNGMKLFSVSYGLFICKTILIFLCVSLLTPLLALPGTCTAFLAGPLTAALISLGILCIHYKIRLNLHIDRSLWKRVLSLSGFVAISIMLLNVIYHIGAVLLTFIKGAESTSYYNIGLSFMQIIQVTMVFPTIFLPIAVQMNREKKYTSLKKVLYISVFLTLLVLPITALFFHLTSPALINFLFSEKYGRAAPTVTVLCSGLLFYTLSNFLSQILISMNQVKAMALNTLIVTGINILLNLALIHFYDFTGAAFASAISYILLALLNVLLLYSTISRSCRTSDSGQEELPSA